MSPVAVTVELGDRADLAGLQLADRLLVLAVDEQELADPLVLAAVRVPGVALAVERAREDAQVGQPADERIGGGLEGAHEERARGIGGDRRSRRADFGSWAVSAGSSAGEGR